MTQMLKICLYMSDEYNLILTMQEELSTVLF